jgi:hypothetical protein
MLLQFWIELSSFNASYSRTRMNCIQNIKHVAIFNACRRSYAHFTYCNNNIHLFRFEKKKDINLDCMMCWCSSALQVSRIRASVSAVTLVKNLSVIREGCKWENLFISYKTWHLNCCMTMRKYFPRRRLNFYTLQYNTVLSYIISLLIDIHII